MAASSNNAIVNVGRLNAFRLAYVQPALKAIRDNAITITQDGIPLKVRLHSLQIHDVINDAPNTCTLVVDKATVPTTGKRLRITQGVDPVYLLFAGALQGTTKSYVGRSTNPTIPEYQVEAIDDTMRSDWLRPFGAWEGVSATTVAQQLIANFAPGFTSTYVQAGLPAVTLYLDGTERLNGALRLIAKLIGGYYYFEDYTLHLFTGDEPGVNPDMITGAPGQLLDDPPITYTSDDSQIRTRCYGKGHSEALLAALNVNASPIPIANAVMFNPDGGQAISEWQRLTYTGTAIGGDGALVGPGQTPVAVPTLALSAGAGVTAGAHQYAYSWVTGAGETLPGPATSITVTGGPMARPTGPPTFLGHGGVNGQDNVDPWQSGAWKPGDTVEIGYSHASTLTTTAFTPMGPTISVIAELSPYYYHTPGDSAKSLYIRLPYAQDPNVKYLIVWHRVNGGPWRYWEGPVNHPEYLSPYDWNLNNPAYYSSSGATPPVVDVTLNRVAVSGIAIGPAGVTGRVLYRTVAGGSGLLLQTWIQDNTTTSLIDSTPDASLGRVPPATNTAGLPAPTGQVLPGATTMPVSGTAWTRPQGGWASIGNGQQIIYYNGITANSLVGIPATGSGAITAAVNYSSTITGTPMLLGVTGVAKPMIAGAPIHIWVQVDDTGAQAELAARVGGAGVVEHLISDERRGEQSLIALCTADLALYSRPIVTVRYTSFDPKTRSGRPITITLPTLGINTTLLIQDVTIDVGGESPPRYTVTASSVRNSLEDLLRRMSATLDEGF